MNHEELERRIAELPDVGEQGLRLLFGWAADGRPSPVFLTLVPTRDGTVTATWGDLREKVEPVVDERGEPRVFPDEDAACEWAWRLIQDARTPASTLSAEQTAHALASAEAQRRRDEGRRRLRDAEG